MGFSDSFSNTKSDQVVGMVSFGIAEGGPTTSGPFKSPQGRFCGVVHFWMLVHGFVIPRGKAFVGPRTGESFDLGVFFSQESEEMSGGNGEMGDQSRTRSKLSLDMFVEGGSATC